ncbi:hypothetical protein FLGE108171_15870 [Flavobacterium gelidilacus]
MSVMALATGACNTTTSSHCVKASVQAGVVFVLTSTKQYVPATVAETVAVPVGLNVTGV